MFYSLLDQVMLLEWGGGDLASWCCVVREIPIPVWSVLLAGLAQPELREAKLRRAGDC
jgi:hypothetical protein